MFKISAKKEFSAAHKLVGYPGVCHKTHGHNWRVRAVVTSDKVNNIGIGVDFNVLDNLLDQVLARLDHQLLNEVEPFNVKNPTAENIAVYIYDSMKDILPDNVKLRSIEVAESDDFVVTYEP